jgi:hypothetical protein
MTDIERWLFRHSAGFSVILNEGCRSEESLTTSATSNTQNSPLGTKGAGG